MGLPENAVTLAARRAMRHHGSMPAVRWKPVAALCWAACFAGCFSGGNAGAGASVDLDAAAIEEGVVDASIPETADLLEIGPPSDAALFEIEPPDGDAEIDAAFDAPYEVELDAGGDADPLLPGCALGTFKGHSYVFCERDATWDEARTACGFMGRDLVKVEDAEEMVFLRTVIAVKGPNDWHIGLNDRGKEGDFQWTDGKKPGYTNWHKNEPNNGFWIWNNEDCVTAYKDGTWNDVDCGNKYGGFICESK